MLEGARPAVPEHAHHVPAQISAESCRPAPRSRAASLIDRVARADRRPTSPWTSCSMLAQRDQASSTSPSSCRSCRRRTAGGFEPPTPVPARTIASSTFVRVHATPVGKTHAAARAAGVATGRRIPSGRRDGIAKYASGDVVRRHPPRASRTRRRGRAATDRVRAEPIGAPSSSGISMPGRCAPPRPRTPGRDRASSFT